MAELFKNIYNEQFINEYASILKKLNNEFDVASFNKNIFNSKWKQMELKERMRHISKTLNSHIKGDFKRQTTVLIDSITELKIIGRRETSIEFMFGSGLMVEGFLLNNQLTDFSFSPTQDRFPVPNRVEPGKRPRSAMSPTMVFDKDNNLEVVVGSPGGSRIVSYVAQTLIGVLDFGLDIQQAINLPKITNRNDYTALEKGTPLEKLEAPLTALGHNVKVIDLNSGLHGIQFKSGKLIGGADPRREGIAVGR